MEVYGRIGTINRTVLKRRPLGLVDFQALPPWGWCVRCGAEVFEPDADRCDRCGRNG